MEIPAGLQFGPDCQKIGWSCVYCLDPEPPDWHSFPTPGTLAFLAAVERTHFAHHHAPPEAKDTVLRDGISHELAQRALTELCVRAEERQQQQWKAALGITPEAES